MPETRFEAMTPVSGAYQVQFISTSNTSFHFETYDFDMTGAINSGSQQNGSLQANTPQTITVQHSANPVSVNREQIQISQADYYDTRHKDWAFVDGKVTEVNGTKLPSLKGKISVAIGSFSRTFDLRSLMIKKGPEVVYHIETWGHRSRLTKSPQKDP